MNPAMDDDRSRQLRRAVYALLITLSAAGVLGRILAVNSVDRAGLESHLRKAGRDNWRQQRPFLSSNDRSRWATVRALVEHRTYAIDWVVAEPNWDTIDMVQHLDRKGMPRLYSSKPPLLATLLAAPYWFLHRLTGWTLGSHPYEMGRFLLVLVNLLPMMGMFVLVAKLVDRLGTTDWGRMFAMASITFGTFLTTFAVVLNNHLIAAVSASVAGYLAVRVAMDGVRSIGTLATCGAAAAFTATCELPALIFFVLLSLWLWRIAPRETARFYLPSAAVVAVAFFATNYIAHGSLRPPYMHRSETHPEDNWYDYTFVRDGRQRESYWRNPSGIDRGEPSAARYALHVLVGHHGIVSLTPIWLLSLLGMAGMCRRGRESDDKTDPKSVTAGSELQRNWSHWAGWAAVVAATSLVCLVFFLLRPQSDRNYGGMTSGFRWMFWLAPLWTICLVPAADRLARTRSGRAVGLVLLAISVLSASYPTWNPWTHPWITNLMLHLEWIHF
jgi:hypothetical protein